MCINFNFYTKYTRDYTFAIIYDAMYRCMFMCIIPYYYNPRHYIYRYIVTLYRPYQYILQREWEMKQHSSIWNIDDGAVVVLVILLVDFFNRQMCFSCRWENLYKFSLCLKIHDITSNRFMLFCSVCIHTCMYWISYRIV